MEKYFNVTADCKAGIHYMVNLDTRLAKIKEMIDKGDYITIHRGRQYGKTTILRSLKQYLKEEYYVVFVDFQKISNAKFENENAFCLTFSRLFLKDLKNNPLSDVEELKAAIEQLETQIKMNRSYIELFELFEYLNDICVASDKPIVLLIDEVDQATNNQVFLDFLGQLRAYYIDRDISPTFQSVILAGVHDIKNLRRKIRPEEAHRINSPWNIAAEFNVDMSFSETEIAEMLHVYEADQHTGMSVNEMAKLIFDYTSGYPVLVSRLCKLMDEDIWQKEDFKTKSMAWTRRGLQEAVKVILAEKNPLFESLGEKLLSYPELNDMLRAVLFSGNSIAYNYYETSMNIATMFGFIKNKNGALAVSNRIFETWLYNLYLSEEKIHEKEIYAASVQRKPQFVVGGRLNMRLILEKFVEHFHELYGNSTETFLEEVGRKYFLLYLRPIINGTGNYYIEAQTRDRKRTDVIVDYQGEQYIIEMKIWHGNEYHTRGKQQLLEYLDYYQLEKGYMLSFNFNKKKEIGVKEILLGNKVLMEAVV